MVIKMEWNEVNRKELQEEVEDFLRQIREYSFVKDGYIYKSPDDIHYKKSKLTQEDRDGF